MRDLLIERILDAGGTEELIELLKLDIHTLVYEAAKEKLEGMDDDKLLDLVY